MATLNIRGIDDEVAQKVKLAAAARGMTIGQYVAALYCLHRALLDLANWEEKVAHDPDALFSVHPDSQEILEGAGLPVIFT